MNFALRYVRISPDVNSRAELVTLAPGLRPDRRFVPSARGLNFCYRFSIAQKALLDLFEILEFTACATSGS